jgi:hypothetical protein
LRRGKLRSGERTVSKKEQRHFEALQRDVKKKSEAFVNSPTYSNYRKYVIAYCEWAKLRHKAIKRSLMRALRDGSVESIYGRAHSTIASDLKKAGINVNVSIEPGIFSWFAVVKRKAEKRLPIKEIDYKRAFVGRRIGSIRQSDPDYAKFLKYYFLIGKVSEETLNEIIANPRLLKQILEEEAKKQLVK